MKKMNLIKLNEVYDFGIIEQGDGLFVEFSRNPTDYPLLVDFINQSNEDELDEEYFIGHSADKYLSPLAQKIFDYISRDPSAFSERMAGIIYNRFGNKWKKLYDALMTEYNPLDNYSMSEKENQKSDIKNDRTTNAKNSYKGFNANQPVVVNETDGTDNVETSGTLLDNERQLTRSGNIGVTTSQQMLESEFKVRQYDFYKQIYKDIDSILCLSIY